MGAIGAAAYVLIYPRLMRNHIRKVSRKLYSEAANRTVLCWHELEIYEGGFIERTAYNENRSAWGAIERIESAPGYTFIYIGPGNAHVIPHQRIAEGDLREFLVELGKHFRPDATLQPAAHSDSLAPGAEHAVYQGTQGEAERE